MWYNAMDFIPQIVADHDGKALNESTLALVTAASKIGGSVHTHQYYYAFLSICPYT